MRIALRSYYFRSTIDEKKLRDNLKGLGFESEDPLVLSDSDKHWVLITGFGAIVFWPFEESFARDITRRIVDTLVDPFMVEDVEDRLFVESDKGVEKILYNEIWLASAPTFSQLRIIALLLAQSVALDYLDNELTQVLGESSTTINEMKEKGRIRISSRNILKNIGFTMHVRNAVLTNLSLFDKPQETWESESLENLYNGLVDFFDLPERELSLNTKLVFLAEYTTMLSHFLSSRKSQRLEWVIIVLIALELIGFVIYELL